MNNHMHMAFVVQELRPEVLAFALLMEQRLRDKDAEKGQGWKDKTREELEVAATSKMLEIEYSNSPQRAAFHAIDLANCCMFIADVAGQLMVEEDGGPGWAGMDQVNPEPLEIPAFLRMNQIDPHN